MLRGSRCKLQGFRFGTYGLALRVSDFGFQGLKEISN